MWRYRACRDRVGVPTRRASSTSWSKKALIVDPPVVGTWGKSPRAESKTLTEAILAGAERPTCGARAGPDDKAPWPVRVIARYREPGHGGGGDRSRSHSERDNI